MAHRAFRAMGTTVELHLDAPGGPRAEFALDRAEAVFAEVESACSRFDRRSELSRLNALGDARVSPLLGEVVRAALAGRARTGGRFDPTVHDALVAAGYDRTFDEVGDAPLRPAARAGGAVTVADDRVVLGPGVRLDLGGIAKGYAVDRAAESLAAHGPCLVDAGGDIAARGTWPVAVEGGPTLELTDAAVATSGRDRRTWPRGDGLAHHLIDPDTGAPAATPIVRATVVAPTATEAEVLAKQAFLGDPVDAPTVLVLEDGTTVVRGGLA